MADFPVSTTLDYDSDNEVPLHSMKEGDDDDDSGSNRKGVKHHVSKLASKTCRCIGSCMVCPLRACWTCFAPLVLGGVVIVLIVLMAVWYSKGSSAVSDSVSYVTDYISNLVQSQSEAISDVHTSGAMRYTAYYTSMVDPSSSFFVNQDAISWLQGWIILGPAYSIFNLTFNNRPPNGRNSIGALVIGTGPQNFFTLCTSTDCGPHSTNSKYILSGQVPCAPGWCGIERGQETLYLLVTGKSSDANGDPIMTRTNMFDIIRLY